MHQHNRKLAAALGALVFVVSGAGAAVAGPKGTNQAADVLGIAGAACTAMGGSMATLTQGNGSVVPKRCNVSSTTTATSTETVTGPLVVDQDGWVQTNNSNQPNAGEGVWKTTGSQTTTTTTTTTTTVRSDVYNWSTGHSNTWVFLEDQSSTSVTTTSVSTSDTTDYKCMANGHYSKEDPKCDPEDDE